MSINAIKNGLIAALMGFVMSYLVNRYLLPMPGTIQQNAIGNGISGLMSGFMGGFMGALMTTRSQANAEAAGGDRLSD